MTQPAMPKRVAFGIDLAGYAGGNTACVEASTTRSARARIRVIANCPMSRPMNGGGDLVQFVKEEVRFLGTMMYRGPVAVDIPIDLQGLGEPIERQKVWELTFRPIDRVLKALPALAERIGAPVARFQNIMQRGGFWPMVEDRLFETYPRASLQRLAIPGANANEQRSALARSWAIVGDTLNEHEIDAAICALTMLAGPPCRLQKESLGADYDAGFEEKSPHRRSIPKGYILLAENPFTEVTVERVDLSSWS